MPLDSDLPIPVSRETLARLEQYQNTLLQWNERINLIGRSTEKGSVIRHFADSAQLLPCLPSSPSVLLDLGSGAGFPGMVLAMLQPSLEVHLIESDRRKAIFLQEIARLCGVSVQIHCARIEAVPPFRADVVTARALAPLTQLVEWSAPFLHSNSFCLFPKGENYIKELDEVRGWSYDLKIHPSRTQPGSVILQISHLERDI